MSGSRVTTAADGGAASTPRATAASTTEASDAPQHASATGVGPTGDAGDAGADLPEPAQQLLAGLNDAQRRAAATVAGPVRILAGAGTGKTRTITHRIAVQVASGWCSPEQILAVTFTDRAARELRQRLRALGLPAPVRAATFHAAAWAQLRYFWPALSDRPRPQVLASKGEVLAPIARGLRAEVRDLAGEIEWAKARLITPAGYPAAAQQAGRQPPVEASQLAQAWQAYESAKDERDLIDYDDMLLRCAQALTDHPDVAEAVRDRYRVFTVDEFQDVNPAQWQLLRTWLGQRDEVCVVGDDDQTIYRFTGSSPAYLTGFPEAFPGAATVTLTDSYRSTRPVLRLANRVLATKPRSQRKRLRSQIGDGPQPTLRGFADDASERDGVIARVRELLDAGTRPGEIAICYRINAQSADWEGALAEAGIPHLVRGEPGFFAHEAVRQALTVLSEEARAHPDGRREDPARRPDTVPAGPADPVEALERVLRERAGFRPGSPPAGEIARERHEHLAALVELARRVADTEPGSSPRANPRGEHGFATLVADLAERAAAGQETADPHGAVTLLTLHRAKGLEFDAVFVVACEEGLLPISHAVGDDDAVEDERRLLYVGVTRARRHLWLSWADRRGTRGRRRSRLLDGLAGADGPAGGKAAGAGDERRRRNGTAGGPATGDGGQSAACRCGAPLVSAHDRAQGRCSACRADDPDPASAVEALTAWRARRAADDGVAAYVVAHDRTLQAIAERCPDSLEALGAIRGIGPTKLARYGAEILAVLARLRGAAT
jgi:DNA helicase-2/ATP-dependent DNA helicase PcrA